ncbi:MAG: PD40 domain-containing protein [Bdellovibrionales bacterium]|nr:PD40 domain-containing protein [Bdellovibrionales bacterium]
MKFYVTLVFWALLLIPSTTHAEDKVFLKVGEANVKKSLLALTPLQYYGSDKDSKNIQAGQTFYQVTYNDLDVTGLFKFILPSAYLEDVNKVGIRPAPGTPGGFNFSSWKTIGTEFLIRGGYKVLSGNVELEIYLYYVPQGKLVFGKTYKGPLNALRKIAHTFSADVTLNLTGVKGMFNSKVTVARAKKTKNKKGMWTPGNKEIYIMDWDGANTQKISSHQGIATSPAWSPDGKKVAYTAYAYHPKSKTRNADLFIYEIESGKRWLVSYRKGINSGANFLPSGSEILLTLSQKGSPDIFRMSVDGRTIRRLTRGPNRAMNVEPAVSPDGNTIAFSSDRSGRPMLYTMTAGGTNVKRLTHAGRYNSTPTWSSDGKKIAFASFTDGHFDLFIIDKDGQNLKRLTKSFKKNGKRANNEEPTFSPDGRHILFVSDRTGDRQLYVINPDGTNERRITHDSYDYFKPKWSNYID